MKKDRIKNNVHEHAVDEMLQARRRTYFKAERTCVYAYPKCQYCDDDRLIHAKAPNGQELVDGCMCSEDKKYVWRAVPYEASLFVLAGQDRLDIVLPSVEVSAAGKIESSWRVDPDPAAPDATWEMLYVSLFTSVEKFENYCKAMGKEVFEEGMEIY